MKNNEMMNGTIVHTQKQLSWGNIFRDILFWRKRILAITFTVSILAAIVSLLLTKWYESSAVILLPEKPGSGIEALSGTLGGLGQALLGGNIGANPQRYVAILKSRRMKEAVIGRYDLIRAFDYDTTAQDTFALLMLLDETIIPESNVKSGIITIKVRYRKDAVQTAEMTNFVVQTLDLINRELATEQARATRIFIEQRYHQAKEELKIAEDSLNNYQKKYGIIALSEQTKASIEAAARLQAEIVSYETEYNVMKKTLSENHPDLLRLRSTILELRNVERKMDLGGSDLSVLIPFKNTPDLALEYLRRFRDVQINSKILEFLVPQFEQAKIQEAKDTPTLLVLDEAKPAAYPSFPKKKMMTIVTAILTFGMCIGILVIREWMRAINLRNHPHYLILKQLLTFKSSAPS